MAREHGQGVLGRLADGLLQLRCDPSDEVAGEGRQVLEPITERRKADREDAQPEVEVLAEASRLHLLGELAVRRRDDPHVDPPRAILPHRAHLALLQDAQELRLQRRGGLRDLVEEERPAVGDLEEPLPVGDGAGEGTAPMAEELALEDTLRECGAVDSHEEPVATRAAVVDRAGHQLLPGPGLALEKDGRGGPGDLPDQHHHLAHRRALPHDLVGDRRSPEVCVLRGQALVRVPQLLDQAGVLACQLEHLDRAMEGQAKLLALPGLGDVAEDPARVDRRYDRLDVRVACQDDAVRIGAELHRAMQELDAVHVRHALVRDDHGRIVRLEDLEATAAAFRGQHLELVAVVVGEGAEDVGLVVDDHHRVLPVVDLHASPYRVPPTALSSCAPAAAPGSTTRNVVPPPGTLSTSSCPPWAETTLWLMARPSPVPAPTSLVVKNGSKMRPSSSGGMPDPSSRMATTAASPSMRVVTQMFPAPTIASQALASRFMKTWFSWAGSHSTSGSGP